MEQLLWNPRPEYVELTVPKLVVCCFQVAEDGLSGSKPGVITAAAASLVSEMSNIDQVWTGVQYKPCCINCRIGSAVCVCLCMCVRACVCFHINRHCDERRKRKIVYLSQLTRLYRCATVVSILVKHISTKCSSCPRRCVS